MKYISGIDIQNNTPKLWDVKIKKYKTQKWYWAIELLRISKNIINESQGLIKEQYEEEHKEIVKLLYSFSIKIPKEMKLLLNHN